MKTILVVEDDPAVRENIQFLLEEVGYNVVTAVDGCQGIGLGSELKPDLIICDIMMPHADGYRVLETLRAMVETASVPFVFLTAKSEMMDMRRGMQLGADDFIQKPYRAGDLLHAIALQLNKKTIEPVKVPTPARSVDPERSHSEHEIVLAGSNAELFKIGDIKYISAEDEYTIVHTSDGKNHIVRRLLKDWEERLPAGGFIRIHRAQLVNLNYVEKFERWFNNAYRVFVKGVDEPLLMSRRYSVQLRSKVKEHFVEQ